MVFELITFAVGRTIFLLFRLILRILLLEVLIVIRRLIGPVCRRVEEFVVIV
jgi:hypothetical protein